MTTGAHRCIIEYVLFKQRKPNDRYAELLQQQQNSCIVRFQAPLSFEFRGLEHLASLLADHHHHYSGLIVTSQRAVQAIKLAIQGTTLGTRSVSIDDVVRHWSSPSKRVYCVGNATASELQALFNTTTTTAGCTALPNASLLADQIIHDTQTNHHHHHTTLPLLFLCGNLALDTLPTKLQAEHIAFEQLVVYETIKHSQPLPQHDQTTSTRSSNSSSNSSSSSSSNSIARTWWIFFSPSGVDCMAERLQSIPNNTLIAAIGATTASALVARSIGVAVVASAPTPDALVQDLVQYDTVHAPSDTTDQ
jgi:uroporphyrinogen-III synthase